MNGHHDTNDPPTESLPEEPSKRVTTLRESRRLELIAHIARDNRFRQNLSRRVSLRRNFQRLQRDAANVVPPKLL